MQKKLQQVLQNFGQCTYTQNILLCLHMTWEVYNSFVLNRFYYQAMHIT